MPDVMTADEVLFAHVRHARAVLNNFPEGSLTRRELEELLDAILVFRASSLTYQHQAPMVVQINAPAA